MLDCKTDQTQTRTFNKTKGSDQNKKKPRYDGYIQIKVQRGRGWD